ncbi:MAG: hypothetical protein R3C68_07670 [Myxococcota bacterium]
MVCIADDGEVGVKTVQLRLLPLLFVALGASPAAAQMANFLMPEPAPFIAPGRLFSVAVPPPWQVALTEDPFTYQLVPPGSGDAFLSIRRLAVPAGAQPRQMALNAIEQRLSKMPLFKMAMRRDVRIAGMPAASVAGTYAFQGNLQFPRALEEIYLVSGDEAFIFHFECFEPQAGAYADALNRIYESFQPRPTLGSPFAPESDEENFPQLETIPESEKVPF